MILRPFVVAFILLGTSLSHNTPCFGQSSSFPSSDRLAETKITLTRHGCYGTCPRYSVTIFGDGSVVYSGDSSVRVKGKATSKISKQAVEDLVLQTEAMDYFGLQPRQGKWCIDDGPKATTIVSEPGRTRQIDDFCLVNPEINKLETAIDDAINIQQWVFITAGRLRKLIHRGWNVRKHGQAYVEEAISWDDPDVIRLLVSSGIPVDSKDREGNTFLLTAVLGNHFKAAKALLESGANPTLRHADGWTPAQSAGHRSIAMCKLFLEHGAGIDDQDGFGNTMLMNAAHSPGNFEIVKFLVEAGAAPNLRSKNGETAMGLAIEMRQQALHDMEKSSDAKLAALVADGKLAPEGPILAILKAGHAQNAVVVRQFEEVVEYLKQHGGT